MELVSCDDFESISICTIGDKLEVEVMVDERQNYFEDALAQSFAKTRALTSEERIEGERVSLSVAITRLSGLFMT